MINFPAFNRSIYYRLSLVFALLVGAAAGVQLALVIPAYRQLVRELDQRVYWDLADNIAERIQPQILSNDGEADLKLFLTELNLLNPKVELYLLDEHGDIVTRSGLSPRSLKGRVSLEPIEKALKFGQDALPLSFDAYKLDGGRIAMFSVARILLNDRSPGYLLVVLNSRTLQLITEVYGQIFILKAIFVGAVVILLLSTVLGTFLFRYLTKNFRELTYAVADLQAGNLDRRIDVTSQDEIGYLGATINNMADQIQENIRQRQELIASISHDLRSPLTSIRGFIEMLKLEGDKLSSEQQKDYIDKIHRNVELQHHLVSDLFELSKLNASDAKVEIEPFACDELVDVVVSNFQHQASEKGVSLEMPLSPELPRGMGDVIMLERVLGNLIGNAIRYTEPGGAISIDLALLETEEMIKFCIKDSGLGIPEEDLPKIFESFYRVDSARSNKSGGTGLGLAIVKKMVELNQGEVWAESELGVGSEFYFTVPIEKRE